MPILTDFTLPAGAKSLVIPQSSALFVAFVSGNDPVTKQPWCPDVRVALPHIESAFAPDQAPSLGYVQVGSLAEWRDPKNAFRTTWNVNNVPALVRYEVVEGNVVEIGRLIEAEILDKSKVQQFIS